MSAKVRRTVGYSPWGWKAGDIEPFQSLFTHKKSIENDFKDIDCLLLWGGEDIHPSYYHEPPHRENESQGKTPSRRDVHEHKAMLYCQKHNIPMIGICRGGQFITAFAGGSLAQHVDRHHGCHTIRTLDGKVMESTSVHHQMMNPYSVNHILVGWAYPARSNIYEDGYHRQIPVLVDEHEPEIVYYPEVRGLAIQGHPEYSHATHEFKAYCVEAAKKYLFEELSS